MKTYAGDRTIDGIVVTVDGEPLDQRLGVREFTVNGFEWTYEGAESRQLSLAILADHLGNDDQALALVGHGEYVEDPDGIRPALVNVVTDWRARATTAAFTVYST